MSQSYQVPTAMTIMGEALANGSEVARKECPRNSRHQITACWKDGEVVQLLDCPALVDFIERGGWPTCKLLQRDIIGYGCPFNGAPTMSK